MQLGNDDAEGSERAGESSTVAGASGPPATRAAPSRPPATDANARLQKLLGVSGGATPAGVATKKGASSMLVRGLVAAAILAVLLIAYGIMKSHLNESKTHHKETQDDIHKHHKKTQDDIHQHHEKTKDDIDEDKWDAWEKQQAAKYGTKLNDAERRKIEAQDKAYKDEGWMYDEESKSYMSKVAWEKEHQKTVEDETGLAKARMELKDQKLIKGLKAACEAYINGHLYELPPEIEGLKTAEGKQLAGELRNKYAQFMSPPAGVTLTRDATGKKKTWSPLQNVTCGDPNAAATSIPLICGQADEPEPFDHGAYTRLKRCVGPWPTIGGVVQTGCSLAADNAPLYSGQNCQYKTVTGHMRDAMKHKTDPLQGTCSATPQKNLYVPDLVDASKVTSCATIPACDNERPLKKSSDASNLTCKVLSDTLAYYGDMCQYTFNPKTEILDHCIPSLATQAWKKGVQCTKGIGKFAIDSNGAITNHYPSGDVNLMPLSDTNKAKMGDVMDEDCNCKTGYYTSNQKDSKACDTHAAAYMEFDKGNVLVNCKDALHYGPNCEYELVNEQSFILNQQTSRLEIGAVQCAHKGLAYNFATNRNPNPKNAWVGCEAYQCLQGSNTAGKYCDFKCPAGSSAWQSGATIPPKENAEGIDACKCTDKLSKDANTTRKAPEPAPAPAAGGKPPAGATFPAVWCSTNCTDGAVSDGTACIKCPNDSVPITPTGAAYASQCKCDKLSSGGGEAYHADDGKVVNAVNIKSSSDFCSACAPGFERDASNSCTVCNGYMVQQGVTYTCVKCEELSPYLTVNKTPKSAQKCVSSINHVKPMPNLPNMCALFDKNVSVYAAAANAGDISLTNVPITKPPPVPACQTGYGPDPLQGTPAYSSACLFRTVRTDAPPAGKPFLLLHRNSASGTDFDSNKWRPVFAPHVFDAPDAWGQHVFPDNQWISIQPNANPYSGIGNCGHNYHYSTLMASMNVMTWDDVLVFGGVYGCVFWLGGNAEDTTTKVGELKVSRLKTSTTDTPKEALVGVGTWGMDKFLAPWTAQMPAPQDGTVNMQIYPGKYDGSGHDDHDDAHLNTDVNSSVGAPGINPTHPLGIRPVWPLMTQVDPNGSTFGGVYTGVSPHSWSFTADANGLRLLMDGKRVGTFGCRHQNDNKFKIPVLNWASHANVDLVNRNSVLACGNVFSWFPMSADQPASPMQFGWIDLSTNAKTLSESVANLPYSMRFMTANDGTQATTTNTDLRTRGWSASMAGALKQNGTYKYNYVQSDMQWRSHRPAPVAGYNLLSVDRQASRGAAVPSACVADAPSSTSTKKYALAAGKTTGTNIRRPDVSSTDYYPQMTVWYPDTPGTERVLVDGSLGNEPEELKKALSNAATLSDVKCFTK